jgi:glycogen operon protein
MVWLRAFTIQDGGAGDWKRIIDTSLPSPDDFRESEDEGALRSQSYEVKPRSMAVFIRHARDGKKANRINKEKTP